MFFDNDAHNKYVLRVLRVLYVLYIETSIFYFDISGVVYTLYIIFECAPKMNQA